MPVLRLNELILNAREDWKVRKSTLRNWLYWQLFPGVNLHSRQRFSVLPSFFERSESGAPWLVLDAGCGNGMLAYGRLDPNTSVVGVSVKSGEIEKARSLFNEYLEIPESRLRFEVKNLYALDYRPCEFDEIICSEVLEHLRRDREVCESFFRILKPNGLVHICAPNAAHPYNQAFPLDYEERGGHVRPGYTEQSYRELLEPLGFRVERVIGLGGSIRQAFNHRIKETQAKFGAAAGLPLFVLSFVALPFERHDVNPAVPFSIYIKARKPLETG